MLYLENYLNGFIVALGLIMAIGAQNAFVLAQGLRREHHVSVAIVCMTCDAVLITAGTFGLAALLAEHPVAMAVTRWAGVIFLVCYAAFALHRALSSQSLTMTAGHQPLRPLRTVLITTLAITLLNPHVYLDTMVLIGAVGAQQTIPALFVAGAASASVVWFFSLALGAAKLAPLLQRPLTWRLIDLGVAVMMLSIAWRLASPALQTAT